MKSDGVEWSLEEIVMMADSYAPTPGKRGPYKKASKHDLGSYR